MKIILKSKFLFVSCDCVELICFFFGRPSKDTEGIENFKPSTKICIKNIPFEATVEDIRKLFEYDLLVFVF